MALLNSLDDLWKRFGFTPNERQKEAIDHTDGPLYLPAGPGSGKTRVILWRTVNLIARHGYQPEEIFLATFTEKAAGQLREGVRALLGAATDHTDQPYDIGRMYVGTVHSLCQRLTTDRRLHAPGGTRRAPILLDELGQYFHLYRTRRWKELTDGLDLGSEPILAINALFGERSHSRHKAVSNCISLFNRLSEECLDGSNWTDRTFEPDLDPVLRQLLTGYERYLALLAEKPVQTDFSLLQQEALKVLKSYHGLSLFSHVIIDEYQDTNTIQERVFFELARDTHNLCVVGDEDQALYRFRGATVENFVQFPERCEQQWGQKPHPIPLATNYRSRKKIVELYNGSWGGVTGVRTATRAAACQAHRIPATTFAWPKRRSRRIAPTTVVYQPYVSAYEAVRNLKRKCSLPDAAILNSALTYTFRLPEPVRDLIARLYRLDDIELDGLPLPPSAPTPPDSTPMACWDYIWKQETGLFLVVHDERESKAHNLTEAAILEEILAAAGDLPDGSVGLVMPHRAQRSLLTGRLQAYTKAVDVIDTVERLQGGERDTILVSATASDPAAINARAEFELSVQRANVAFSRAKRRLVVVVSETLLSHIPPEIEHYEAAILWKSLRSLCTHVVAETVVDGHTVRVSTLQQRWNANQTNDLTR